MPFSLPFSLPFKGRAGVGMVFNAGCKSTPSPPNPPLEGEGFGGAPHAGKAAVAAYFSAGRSGGGASAWRRSHHDSVTSTNSASAVAAPATR